MDTLLNALYLRIHNLVDGESGQDLVEYALVFSLIAFGAITGMGYLANGINTEFSNINVALTSSTS